eukprot:CAMPEP_0196823294 /NCGR_PEP_ID=MMETSP1362-20130617/86893_1 /TAXON_ID=163516 /ORGANISM="Leptocylindrus danicus, Strain CCMP1856" /LENGTH=140 /DNA_ID=CAMNT_0042203117 /DNA_START=148 /DNA_END=567 /DNA_ORIENTATION=+
MSNNKRSINATAALPHEDEQQRMVKAKIEETTTENDDDDDQANIALVDPPPPLLPSDVVSNVLSFLNLADMARCSRASTTWRKALSRIERIYIHPNYCHIPIPTQLNNDDYNEGGDGNDDYLKQMIQFAAQHFAHPTSVS